METMESSVCFDQESENDLRLPSILLQLPYFGRHNLQGVFPVFFQYLGVVRLTTGTGAASVPPAPSRVPFRRLVRLQKPAFSSPSCTTMAPIVTTYHGCGATPHKTSMEVKMYLAAKRENQNGSCATK